MSHKAKHESPSRGMTLVEVLISLAILAVAAVVALTLYDVSRKSFKGGENRTEQQQAVRAAFDRMVADLRMTGYNYNPDGAGGRPDEQIEAAFDTAIVIRADFDAENATLSATPESTLAGGGMMTVSTGNDEIVAYVLAKADGSSTGTVRFVADVAESPRDGDVELVAIPNVAVTHDDPPYTLYRVSLNNDANTWGGSTFFTRTPLIENVYSMDFDYHSISGAQIAAPGGLDSGTQRAERENIKRIGLSLVGMTRDPEMEWRDANDPIAATQPYRKFELTSDITPRNIGMIGIQDIASDVTPPSQPGSPSLLPGHCGGLLVAWSPNPTNEQVAYYRVNYGTAPGSASGMITTDQPAVYISGLADATQYYVTIQAIDAAANISIPSSESSATTADQNVPQAPMSLTASYDLNGAVNMTWDAVTQNTAALPSGDPRAPQIRDLAGYRVFRNDHSASIPQSVPVADETILGPRANPSHADIGIVNCRNYKYWVAAVDTCGNQSGYASPAIGAGYSHLAPVAPVEVQSFFYGIDDVKVTWEAVVKDVEDTDIYIDTYKIYRSAPIPLGMEPTSDGAFTYLATVTEATEFIDNSPLGGYPTGYTIFYKISAADDCGNESALSEQTYPQCAFSGEVIFASPRDNEPVAGVVPTTVTVAEGTDEYTGIVLEFYHEDLGQITDRVEITDPGPTWTYNWLANPPGPYMITASVSNSQGCTKTETIHVSAGYGVGCCLSPANPEIRPMILECLGNGGAKCEPIAYRMINNNCLTAVAVEAMQITWVDNTTNDPKLESVFFDGSAIWSPGNSNPLASPASTSFSDPKPAIGVNRNSSYPVVVTYEYDSNMSERGIGQNTLTTTYSFRLLDSQGVETAITGECGPNQGMFNDMLVEPE